MALSASQLERHKRHILLKEIGGPGVQKLSQASVTIVGAGALGGPCALYLAAVGVGRIELWDDDVVDRSNLQRQVQFAEADIGSPKVDILGARLTDLNPDLKVEIRRARFETDSVINGAILIAERGSGAVRAYVGSSGYQERSRKGAVNYLMAKRSPGSTLKPLIYARRGTGLRFSAGFGRRGYGKGRGGCGRGGA